MPAMTELPNPPRPATTSPTRPVPSLPSATMPSPTARTGRRTLPRAESDCSGRAIVKRWPDALETRSLLVCQELHRDAREHQRAAPQDPRPEAQGQGRAEVQRRRLQAGVSGKGLLLLPLRQVEAG